MKCSFLGDQCPMHFDDGTNPWMKTENAIQIFNFGYFSGSATNLVSLFALMLAVTIFLAP